MEPDKVFGYEKFPTMECPHCNNIQRVELIELKVFTRIYSCPCGREIHKKTLAGQLVPWMGLPA